MKCGSCGSRVRMPDSAPGTFFLIGSASAVIALLAGLWLRASGGESTPALVLAGIGILSAPYCAAATWAAMIDSRSMGVPEGSPPGRRCDACGHVNRIRPWSR